MVGENVRVLRWLGHCAHYFVEPCETEKMRVKIVQRPSLNTDRNKPWLYCTTGMASYRFQGISLPNCDIYHGKKMLGSVLHNILTIYRGYAFDGMTNWPDSAANLPCALLHDFLYQTALLDRDQADEALRACMESNGAGWRRTVWFGVRLFGWIHFADEVDKIRIIRQ